ncbi:hypothetical protein HDE_08769 [Halotydeus destructor]|nr:hypothetical protein HDE_08769 [Halotydeus destructor]
MNILLAIKNGTKETVPERSYVESSIDYVMAHNRLNSSQSSTESSDNSKLINGLDSITLSSSSSSTDSSDISAEFDQLNSALSSACSQSTVPQNLTELDRYIRDNALLDAVLKEKKLSLARSPDVMNYLRANIHSTVNKKH